MKKTAVEDPPDDRADVADLVGEALRQRLLGDRLRLRGRVREQGVDPLRDVRGLRRIGDAHDVPADDPLPVLAGLVEVVVVEEELGRVGRA